MSRKPIPTANTTAIEIKEMLECAGASDTLIEYNNEQPAAISFTLQYYTKPARFHIPCEAQVNNNVNESWLLLARWIEAQLEFAQGGMAHLVELFLLYLIDDNNINLHKISKTLATMSSLVDRWFNPTEKGGNT